MTAGHASALGARVAAIREERRARLLALDPAGPDYEAARAACGRLVDLETVLMKAARMAHEHERASPEQLAPAAQN